MRNIVIVGMQWGDEGKGKIVDLICPAFDAVARFQGGHNAGHTVRFGEEHFSLHLIPSGILQPGMACALGNGLVVAPEALFAEIDKLAAAGIETQGRLFLSNRAHVVFPSAVVLDKAREEARGKSRIGTTARGIGPTYEGKISRFGLRLCDLFAPDCDERLERLAERARRELEGLGAEIPADLLPSAALLDPWRQRLEPMLADTELLFHGWKKEGKSLLLEGAQGALLDVDHGTFPYVTSSNSTAGGACTGTGLPPTAITGVLGVLKAYSTRVGGGPFATELHDATGGFLRSRGNEFGTTTGRPRRCGWLDLVAARYACRLNGISGIALTKLDVLDELDEIQVCTGYRQQGQVFQEYGARFETAPFEPVTRTVPGWKTSTVGITREEDLPPAARAYVEFLEAELEVSICLLSTGPRREETLLRDSAALDGILGDRGSAVRARLKPA